MSYQTIAVGIDFSPESEVAAARAIEVARRTGGKVVLVHIGRIPDEPQGVPESMSGTLDEYRRLVKAQIDADRGRLSEMRERLEGQGPEISHVVRDGFDDTGLCDAAAELDADLIVVGTHGRTGIRWFLLGSVAQRVVRFASCDVLVARGPAHTRPGFQHILVPTDFSAQANRALDVALDLVPADGELDLLHSVETPPPGRAVISGREAFKSLHGAVVAGVEKRGLELIDRVDRKDLTIRFHCESGPAKSTIPLWAEKGKHDLVIMGSRGERGARRWLLGSVAEATVQRAPCSVLVCHSGEEAAQDG